MNDFVRRYWLPVSVVLVIVVVSLALTLMIPSDEWVGYWGNLLGGIIGGLVTLVALFYTFDKEKERALEEERSKIIVARGIIKAVILPELENNYYLYTVSRADVSMFERVEQNNRSGGASSYVFGSGASSTPLGMKRFETEEWAKYKLQIATYDPEIAMQLQDVYTVFEEFAQGITIDARFNGQKFIGTKEKCEKLINRIKTEEL